jgi:hypothetical protein
MLPFHSPEIGANIYRTILERENAKGNDIFKYHVQLKT